MVGVKRDTRFTREIYRGAKLKRIKVQRSISQSPDKRVKVNELIAVFKAPIVKTLGAI